MSAVCESRVQIVLCKLLYVDITIHHFAAKEEKLGVSSLSDVLSLSERRDWSFIQLIFITKRLCGEVYYTYPIEKYDF